MGRKSVVTLGKNNDVLVTFSGLRKKEPTDWKRHVVEVLKMNETFGVTLEENETPRHQEKMLIIRCTVSGHHHHLITERHTLPAALLAPGLLSIHSTLPRSLLCRDQRQPNPRTGTPIVHDVFVSLITWELWLCEDTAFLCNFVTNHFPMTFWGLRQVGQGKIVHIRTGSVWHITFTVVTLTPLQAPWNILCY